MTFGSSSLRRRSPRPLRPGAAILILVILAGCGELAQPETPLEPQFANGGGGPPVRVTSTDPTGSVRDTTLDVRVIGSNFEAGSTVEFLLGGVPVTKVRTNSTTFVSDGELRANITIDFDADLGLYDVEVLTPPGKKGVGTELFEVRDKNGVGPFPAPIPLMAIFDDSYAGVQSDGLGDYVDGVDLVKVILRENGNLNYDSRDSRPSHFGGSRLNQVRITEPTATGENVLFDDLYRTQLNTNPREPADAVLATMAPGTTGYTKMGVHIYVDGEEYIVFYGRDCDGNFIAAERGFVDHPDDSTWILSASAGALCVWVSGGPGEQGAVPVVGHVSAPFKVTLVRK